MRSHNHDPTKERLDGLDAAGLIELGAMIVDCLDVASLLALQASIADRLAEANLGEPESQNEAGTAPKYPPEGDIPTGHPRGRRWMERKMINGCGPYLYERWFEGGRKRSRYIGKAEPKQAG